MKKEDKARSALLAVFPTVETFARFTGDNGNSKTVRSFIEYAARNGIIDASDEDLLGDFIGSHARPPGECTPPNHLTFEELFEKKADLLALNLSARTLTERINVLIAKQGIELPRLTNSMLTRLKKEPADTPHKQNALRSLAFWLGHERGDLGPTWNFETLLKLCREGKQPVDYPEGVRIGFALYSRGDVIDHEIVSWLKKDLKNYIEQSMGRFLYGRWARVRSHDITTLYLDFPKEAEASSPAAYRQCLRSAVSVAHRMAIRWALSKYCTRNRFLSIGIAAGDYANLDNYLLPILNAKLPGDPVIRMTDFARQCLLINDIRAILCSRPSETTLFNGETLNIWWVVGIWSYIYFDFIPDLLEDRILKNEPASLETLTKLFWPPDQIEPSSAPGDESNAVSTFLKFPHNSLLGVEIAKTLYHRRRFWEAIEILRIVLSIDPTHLTARTLRMVLFRNLAVEAPSYSISENLFRQSELEAFLIQENGAGPAEDFYCEYAVNFLARAMLTVRHMRGNKELFHGPKDMDRLKERVFDSFDRAEALFRKGISVSPSGIRSMYLVTTVKILKAILKDDEEIFTDPEKPMDGKPEIIRKTCSELRWEIGMERDDLPLPRRCELIEETMLRHFRIHDDSISLQAYRPTTYFCSAVANWDFMPVRTVSVAKRCIRLLSDAADMAGAAAKDDVCIYSFTRTYGEMMPAGLLIEHLQKSIRMIQDLAGKDLSKRDDGEVIEADNNRSSLLLTLNF